MKSLRRKGGFTLVEIMIVVAIIALLAAIAIPNFMRMRINANETAAIANLKAISTAEEAYRAAQNPPTYGDFDALSGADPSYLDSTWTGASVDRQGYTYSFTVAPAAGAFEVTTAPTTDKVTGVRTFSVSQEGVVMDETNAAPIQ